MTGGPVYAGAKLTLSFRVLGRRGDGYHDVEGVMAALTAPADKVGVVVSGAPFLEVTGVVDDVPTDDTNLAVRAVDALYAELGMDRPPLGVRLEKSIPTGAGLGGGSADAAAVLACLNDLSLDRRLTGDALARVAAGLGSDVPVCLRGGLNRVSGRGEVVEPLAFVGGWWAVVAVPEISLATADVYAAWDALDAPASSRVVAAPPVLGEVAATLVNDLEPAALVVAPELEEFRAAFERVAGLPPVLAGSGSAYFVVTDDGARAEAIARAAADFARLSIAAAPSEAGCWSSTASGAPD